MEFDRDKFLLYLLAGIFAWQAALFSYGVYVCAQVGFKLRVDACPELRLTYENTTNLMVATVLALIGGRAVVSASTRRKPSVYDPDASASQPPQPPAVPSSTGLAEQPLPPSRQAAQRQDRPEDKKSP